MAANIHQPIGAPAGRPPASPDLAATLETLLAIATTADASLGDQTADALAAVVAHVGVDVGEAGRRGEDGVRPLNTVFHDAALRAAAPAAAARAAAAVLAPAGGPAFLSADTAADGHHALAALGIGSALVRAVEASGEVFTFAFLAAAPRAAPFSDAECRLVERVAQWFLGAVERQRRIRGIVESRDELAMIVENLSSPIAAYDQDGRIVAANDSGRRVRRPTESRGIDARALSTGMPLLGRVEAWDDGEGGERWMRTDRIPYENPAGDGARLLLVATDVTEMVEKKQQLAKANAGLNQFAYVASHDLQEPLRKIGTFTDLLTQSLEKGDAEEVAYATRVIKDSARRARALITDLLAWSRLGNRKLERVPVDVPALVRDTLAELMASRRDVPVEIDDRMTDGVVAADASQLRQLVENLLVNALKYRHPDRPAAIALRFERRADGSRVLEVADRGIGFDPAHAAVIFEPFRRLHADRQYAGTGVGLAICARVCERHGWTISADARPGEGAVFRVEMPARPLRAEPPR